MFKKFLVAAAIGFAGVSASAADGEKVSKSIELKDGSTVHVFKDGKMAMESKFGHTFRMNDGHVMETKDGQKIVMAGDEVARLQSALRTDYRGGK